MKRTIVASVLGMAGSLAMVGASHAQGTVYFQNYASAVAAGGVAISAPVTFASAGAVSGHSPVQAGWGVGSEFTADLLYSTASVNGGAWTLLTFANSGATAQGAFGYPAAFGYGSSVDGALTTPAGGNPGYFLGAGVTIPGYTGGAISFQLEVYNGASYAASVGAGLWRGLSPVLAMSSIATGTTPTGYLNGLQGFTVTSVPEPATIALGGLGLASLLVLRRKKV